jgi:uracil-DNA glycosylase
MKELEALHQRLKACRKCPNVCGHAVHGPPLRTKIMLVGQAPGVHEGSLGRPFAYTAGKTLFKWMKASLGAEEEDIRELFYFTAVARCFPGKGKSGKGDRVPSRDEIENCSEFLRAEIALVKPEVILAVGKLAIGEVLREAGVSVNTPLEEVVGKVFETSFYGRKVRVIPLPHPSGVSRWPVTEPGKTKLAAALKLLAREVRARV